MDEGRARALLRAERAEVATQLRRADEEADEAVAGPLQERLAVIDRALARIEAGAFGHSVLSGRPIPEQWLEADPATEMTVEEARAQR